MFHVEQPLPNKFLDIFCEGSKNLGWSFSGHVLNLFDCYYKELCEWDKVVNLTSLREDKERVGLLFLDSLHGRLVLEGSPDKKIVDIGTGAGFPGIPLQILFPEKRFSLVEAKAKKAIFLVNVIGKLSLSNANVIQKRVEHIVTETKGHHDKWDMAMIKGVNISHIIPYLRNILSENGKLLVFRSKKHDALKTYHDLIVADEYTYELPFGFGERVISLLQFR